MALLETDNLTVTFGGLRAVDDVSIKIDRGQLVGLIGPNGAGKTTFIDALTGFVPMTGRIHFDGRDLTSAGPHDRARAGMVRTWQSLELFDDLTVRENLRVAAERSSAKGFILDLVAPNRTRVVPAVEDALTLLELQDVAQRMPSELSQGQRKLVGVARALAASPRLVLMDEPAAGLDTAESQDLGRRLRHLVATGTTIFLIDHDMGLVLNVCDYLYVIEFGRLIAEGTPADIRANERVIAAYLGEAAREQIEEVKADLASVPIDLEP
ncbi:MAG TPA: ABC transporter ATP-binding protein [Acidimicrobiales bacterium]|nr:ABC transporter ATP-binding protein [Acidimicrobiales bacterium]